MKKYNKAAFALLVGAVATIVDFYTSIDVPPGIQAAITTIVVFFVPNVDDGA
jgi:hypothetical protein